MGYQTKKSCLTIFLCVLCHFKSSEAPPSASHLRKSYLPQLSYKASSPHEALRSQQAARSYYEALQKYAQQQKEQSKPKQNPQSQRQHQPQLTLLQKLKQKQQQQQQQQQQHQQQQPILPPESPPLPSLPQALLPQLGKILALLDEVKYEMGKV